MTGPTPARQRAGDAGEDVRDELVRRVCEAVPVVGATLPDEYPFTMTITVTAAELRALAAARMEAMRAARATEGGESDAG